MNTQEKIKKINAMKGREKIAMLTTYDFVTATYLNEAGIEIGLVGDSVGNVLLGYKNTQPVTMAEMLHHTSAVARANPKFLLVGDMPNGSYSTPKLALENAKKFVVAGAEAVKVEGAVIDVVEKIVAADIPVMGHVGLLPQSIVDWKVQGKDEASAKKILEDALALEQAGCFSLIIETVPAVLGKKITDSVSIPAIGIGAGPDCDGQVLVINDLLGFNAKDFSPRFVKKYADLKPQVLDALKNFKKEVREKKFPGKENSY